MGEILSEVLSREYFKECTKDIMDKWKMSDKEFAKWLGITKSTMYDYLNKDYEWKRWSSVRIKILILSVGESITTSEAFRNKIVELGTNNVAEIDEKNYLEEEKDTIRRCFRNTYENKDVEKYAIETLDLVEKKYKEIEEGKIEKDEAQKEKIKEWIREKFPTVAKRCGLLPDVTDFYDADSSEDAGNPSVESVSESCTDKENTEDTSSSEDAGNPSAESVSESCTDKENTEDTSSSEDIGNPSVESVSESCTDKENTEDTSSSEDTGNPSGKSVSENYDDKRTTDNIKPAAGDEDLKNMPREKKVSIINQGNSLKKRAKEEYKEAKRIKKLTKLKKPEELKAYIQHLENASNCGYVKAIYRLGMAYKYDTKLEENYAKAVDCFFRAGNMKMEDALYELADCYQNGVGIEKNAVKAELLVDILKHRGYQPKLKVDIRLDQDSERDKKFERECKAFLRNFSPQTEEEQKLMAILNAWKNE